MIFDRILIADWSGAGRPSPARASPNAIWLAEADVCAGILSVSYLRTRAAAEEHIGNRIGQALVAGARLLIAADVAFGFPAGFAVALTRRAEALAVWDWLAARISDGPDNANTHRQVAAEANAAFAGGGPFWGNGASFDVKGLARRRPPLPPGLAAHRQTEMAAWTRKVVPKPVWQLAGAGAVGAQTLLAIPMFCRLRAAHPGRLKAWPLEPVGDARVVVAETYLSILGPEIDMLLPGRPGVHDEHQVRLLAAALAELGRSDALGALFEVPASPEVLRDEGWILGVGHEARLRCAALRVGAAALRPDSPPAAQQPA
jgi:molybdopterin molybdotransferase